MAVTFTPAPTGTRTQMGEVGIYAVLNDKIIQEEFLYQVD